MEDVGDNYPCQEDVGRCLRNQCRTRADDGEDTEDGRGGSEREEGRTTRDGNPHLVEPSARIPLVKEVGDDRDGNAKRLQDAKVRQST